MPLVAAIRMVAVVSCVVFSHVYVGVQVPFHSCVGVFAASKCSLIACIAVRWYD
jgi:hypothetical protein